MALYCKSKNYTLYKVSNKLARVNQPLQIINDMYISIVAGISP